MWNRSIAHSSRRQSTFLVLFALGLSALLLAGVVAVHLVMRVPIGYLTRDPVTVLAGPMYAGLFSQVGIAFWVITATLCLAGAWLVARTGNQNRNAGFLAASGLITMMLGLDDALLLHENVFPKLGMTELMVFGCYGGLTLCFLWRFRHTIWAFHPVLLALAFGGFAASVAIDQVPISGVDPFLMEDGAKLIGIVAWMCYFTVATRSAVLAAVGLQSAALVQEPSTLPLGKPRRAGMAESA